MFHHKLLTREGRVFGQWMNSSIIHDSMCSLMHKRCHPKGYHRDIRYHVTLTTIFSVASSQSSVGGRYNLSRLSGMFQVPECGKFGRWSLRFNRLNSTRWIHMVWKGSFTLVIMFDVSFFLSFKVFKESRGLGLVGFRWTHSLWMKGLQSKQVSPKWRGIHSI